MSKLQLDYKEEEDLVELPESPVTTNGSKKRTVENVLTHTEQLDSSPPVKRIKIDKTPTASTYSLLEFKVDRKPVDQFVLDLDAEYELLAFKYTDVSDKYDDLRTAEAELFARPNGDAFEYRIKVKTTFKAKTNDSFEQLHDLLKSTKTPIPCNKPSNIFKFFSELCKCRNYTGASLTHWEMVDFAIEVPGEWEGTQMAYDATLNFKLRNSTYEPGPICTEACVFITSFQFKKVLDACK